jgi:hypothetical protein
MEQSVYNYIAIQEDPAQTNRAIDFVVSKGYPKPKKRRDIAESLYDYAKNNKENLAGLREIVAKLHPDREMFLMSLPVPTATIQKKEEIKPTEEKMNCSGNCKCKSCPAASETKMNAIGMPTINPNVLIISGVALLSIAIITTVIVAVAKKG